MVAPRPSLPRKQSAPPPVEKVKADAPELKRVTPRIERTDTRGDRMVRFIQTLKVADGPDAGKLIELRDWQINMIKEVYDPENWNERFQRMIRQVRTAIYSLARKNGKTAICGGLLCGHLLGPEAIWNDQIYSAAYDRSQAALVYRSAVGMIMQDDELRDLVRCTDSSKRIWCPVTNSTYQALSAESRSKHGMNPSFVIFDELAQFGTDRELYDVLATSMGAQASPLMMVISTQAPTDAAILSQLIDYGLQNPEDETFKLFLYAVPEDKDPYDEKNWKLANPALDDFRSIEEMRQFANRAKKMPAAESTFRNLYLNQRVQMETSFISKSVWTACKDLNITEEDLRDSLCWGGLDLSSRLDITALVLCFALRDGRYFELPFCWTPRDTLEERSKTDVTDYIGWVEQGFMFATPGKSVDYRFVIRQIAELKEEFNIAAIGYDRWRIDTLLLLADEMEVELPPMIPFGQGFKDISPAIETVESLAIEGKLVHNGHPVLTQHVSNIKIEKDASGNRKVTKAKSYGRIDSGVAMLMATQLAVRGQDERKGEDEGYRKSGLIIL